MYGAGDYRPMKILPSTTLILQLLASLRCLEVLWAGKK